MTCRPPTGRQPALPCLLALLILVALPSLATGASAAPSDTTANRSSLVVSNLQGMSGQEQITFTALQGLVNRSGPHLFLDGFSPGRSTDGLATTESLARLDLPEQHVAPFSLFTRYRSLIKGLVIWDPNLIVDTENAATSLAGIDDALPVGPAMAARLEAAPYRFPVLTDLRSLHFQTRAQVYAWALKQDAGKAPWACPAWMGDDSGTGLGDEPQLRDWVVAHRCFAFEADPSIDQAVVSGVLGSFPTDSPVYGYIFYSDAAYKKSGVAILESAGVGEISKAGDYLVPTVSSTNLTVYAQVHAAGTPPAPHWDGAPRAPAKHTVYVTFMITDGDNISADESQLQVVRWPEVRRQQLPIGVSVSVQLQRLDPSLWAYFLRTLPADAVLVAGPSGAGYAYPSEMPDLSAYLATTRPLLDRSGMHAVWILDNGYGSSPSAATVDHYQAVLHPEGIFTDYDDIQGEFAIPNPPAISFAGGLVPVVHDVYGLSVAGTVAGIRATAKAAGGRPAFVFIGLDTWNMGAPQAAQVMKSLGPGYEAVRPDTFLGLIKGAQRAGELPAGLTSPTTRP